MKNLLLLSLLFLFSNVYSQKTISGRITDKSSNAPLFGAEIIILDLKKKTVASEDGTYKIQNLPSTGKFSMQVKYMGYTTLTELIDLSTNPVYDFALEKAKIELKEVIVTAINGYRSDSAQIGSIGSIPIKDIPFSINITSNKLIENCSAHTLTSALQTNPTAMVVMLANNDGRGGSEMGIRGFDSPLILQDGLILNTNIQIPIEGMERLEVMNGLSGLFYGFQSLAGTINFVSKQATTTPITSFTVGQYNGGLNYLHADLGGKIDTSGRLTYRVNALTEDGNSYIQDSKQKRTYLVAALKANFLMERT
jgi:outer membrane receptor for ferric coprogen and ferric-rhodotorulic acid